MTSSQPFILFVLGGPGAGKGTQCTRLVADFNFVHLSAGDLLREEMAREGSEFSELIGKCIKEGSVVPVEVTLALLKAAMERTPEQPFLIDGYPRAMSQAKEFEKQITSCKAVLYFKCTEAAMRERLLNRGKSSGRTDDNEESIVKRFVTFNETSYPVIQHYQERNLVIEIDTEDTPDNVYKITHDAVAQLLNKESTTGKLEVPAESIKEDEVSPIEIKKSKKKNNKKKNKGSVSSQNRPSDNDTDKENNTSAPAPLTTETFKPIGTIKEVETESAPVEIGVPTTEDVISQPETSNETGLESDKPSEVIEPKEIAAPIVLEQKTEVVDKLADSPSVDPIIANEQDKEITVLSPAEILSKEESLPKADATVNINEVSEDIVPQSKDSDIVEASVVDSAVPKCTDSDQVQEHIESEIVVPAEKPQNVFTPEIPVVDQTLNEDISNEKQKLDSVKNSANLEDHASKFDETFPNTSVSLSSTIPSAVEEVLAKPESLVNEVEKSGEALKTSVSEESVSLAESVANDTVEKLEESFTIPAIPTELEIKQVETVHELVKKHNASDILKDIPSQPEAISSKIESVPSIPEKVVTKSDDFLGSFADQIKFSDFKAPDTAFSLPSFNTSSKLDVKESDNILEQTAIPTESILSSFAEKVVARSEQPLEAVSDQIISTEAKLTDNLSNFNENVESNFNPVNVSSPITELPGSIDQNQKQAETAITNEIKSIQDQVESKVAPTSETVHQVISTQPEAIQSSLVKEIPAGATLPISASITELEKINKPEVAVKDTITDVKSQINDQVSAINSSVVDQLSSTKLSESTPVNEDSIPKLPTPATLSEKLRDIPLPIPDSPAASVAPDRSVKSKSKKKSGCTIM